MNIDMAISSEQYTRKKSLRWSMVRRLLFGWFFPLFMLILIMILLITGNLYRQMEHTITASMEKTADIMQIQLKDCETASKNASYMGVISKSYAAYLNDENRNIFEKCVENFLNQQYAYNDNCKTAQLIVLGEEDICYYALNNSNGGSYQDIVFFRSTSQDIILDVAKTLDTGTTLVCVDGRIYMVRNLVTSKFVPYAVLSLELDEASLMQSFPAYGVIPV